MKKFPFIEEAWIDATIRQIADNDEQSNEVLLERFKEAQPQVLAYVFSETFALLVPEEKEQLLFMNLVLWSVLTKHGGQALPILSDQIIGDSEEQNWSKFLGEKGSFREKLNIFFENYPQEDLLAFVEDFLMSEEEEGDLSKEGQEYLFIGLKSIMDAYLGLS